MSPVESETSCAYSAPGRDRLIVAVVVVIGVLLALTSVASLKSSAERSRIERGLAEHVPKLRADAYVSSNKCQACHPGEYASWHKTFHRTMTQAALPEKVLGDFGGQTVMSDGLAYRVFKKGDEFWAEMPDPEEMMYVVQGGKPMPLEEIPRVERQVVMSTGSHHYQTYWVTGDTKYGNLLQTLPLIYLIKEKRWIPREAAFMMDPDRGQRMITQWNNHCISCHSTGGNPKLQEKTKEGAFLTQVGELGISCEACHGPAEEHIAANRNPLRRYALHESDAKHDATIVNPEKLDHELGSEVCGQCHGVYIRTGEHGMKYARDGVQFRPGDRLSESRFYIFHPRDDSPAEQWDDYRRNPQFFAERWWADGTILAGGREYTAMAVSDCYTKGEMSCFSCHSMHQSKPADQLNKSGHTNAACTQCHSEPQYSTNVASHTHHRADSQGSQCMNCHMPHTSYALFSAIRSHQIESPDIAASAKHGVPNACNLCHLDKTLQWSAAALTERYGAPQVSLTIEQREVSAALLWMLKGHAAQRVITAWHAGWEPALEASGRDWLAPFQAQLLDDPYGVVRYVAARKLTKLSGFENFSFNFIASPEERSAKKAEAVAQWVRQQPGSIPSRTGPAVLLNGDGSLEEERLQRLLRERDNRPVHIKE